MVTMNSPTKLVLVLMSLSFLVSCSTTRTMLMSHSSTKQTDTVYLSNVRYDSVYVSHDSRWEYHRANEPSLSLSPSPVDTVVITKVETEYRYQLLRDTIERIKIETVRDSIPYEVRVVDVKEVSYTPLPVKILAWIGGIFLLLLLIWFIRKLS